MAGQLPSGATSVGSFTVHTAAVSRGQFVSLYSDTEVRACNDVSAPFGVALTDAAVGESVVIVRGYCFALAGAAVNATSKTECSVDADGRLVASGDFTSGAKYVAANPMRGANAAGDLFPVFFNVYLSDLNHAA